MNRSKVQLDIQSVHADDIGQIVGEFHGTPIREWYPTEASLREYADAAWRIAVGRAHEKAAR